MNKNLYKSPAEEQEQALNALIVGDWSPRDLEGALRIAVAFIRDGKNIPKDYYVQPLIKLFKRERQKDLKAISFHFGIPVEDLEKALNAKPFEDIELEVPDSTGGD